MDLLPFAREFMFPGLGAINRLSSGDWIAWKYFDDGMKLVQLEGKMATFTSPEAAHLALMNPNVSLGPFTYCVVPR